MADKIQFTRNYRDDCTNQGFQFEFYCDHCGSGFRTRFKRSITGTATQVLGAASSLLGGVFGTGANAAEQVHDFAWEKAHDQAFVEAMEELKPDFRQCPRCRSWVCRASCWNERHGLCKTCAPDLAVEMAAAQASKSVEEVWAHAKMSEEDLGIGDAAWRETRVAVCPQCEAPLDDAKVKFCPECGAKLSAAAHCTGCGAKLTPGAKFCGECGQKME